MRGGSRAGMWGEWPWAYTADGPFLPCPHARLARLPHLPAASAAKRRRAAALASLGADEKDE